MFLFSMTTAMEREKKEEKERLVLTVATTRKQTPPNFDYVTATSLFRSSTAMDCYHTVEGVETCGLIRAVCARLSPYHAELCRLLRLLGLLEFSVQCGVLVTTIALYSGDLGFERPS